MARSCGVGAFVDRIVDRGNRPQGASGACPIRQTPCLFASGRALSERIVQRPCSKGAETRPKLWKYRACRASLYVQHDRNDGSRVPNTRAAWMESQEHSKTPAASVRTRRSMARIGAGAKTAASASVRHLPRSGESRGGYGSPGSIDDQSVLSRNLPSFGASDTPGKARGGTLQRHWAVHRRCSTAPSTDADAIVRAARIPTPA